MYIAPGERRRLVDQNHAEAYSQQHAENENGTGDIVFDHSMNVRFHL
jgi:hypothetical protein